MSWEVNSEDMCRACMRVDCVLLPMYDGKLLGKNLPEKLADLASIQISRYDGLPTKLCAKCAYRADAFYDFKMQVRASEEKLRKMFELMQAMELKVEPTYSEDDYAEAEYYESNSIPDEYSELERTGSQDSAESQNVHAEALKYDEPVNSFSEGVEFSSVENQDQTEVKSENENDMQILRIQSSAEMQELLKGQGSDYTIVYVPEASMSNDQADVDSSELHNGALDTEAHAATIANDDTMLEDNDRTMFEEDSEPGTTTEPRTNESSDNPLSVTHSELPIKFFLGMAVDGEDSENDDRPAEVQNTTESDGNSTDCYSDSNDNILGSLNDTIVKIREIKTELDVINYQCTLCMQNYEKLSAALVHVADNHVPATGPFFCTVCEKDCESRRDLRQHVKVHKGPLPYSCFLCDKAYAVRRYLRRHMAGHTEFPRHRCPKCGERFSDKTKLENHVTSHSRGSPYACNQCPRVFNHKGNYKRHLITHLDPQGLHLPKFPCKICGKRFLNNRTLETHMRVHTGEKPFKCNVCNKSFSQQGNLLNHKRIHLNPRSYTCEVCGKQFNQRATLKDHSLLHTGEKPYVCTVCGIAFTFSAALRRHMWTHAGGKPYGCEICDSRFVGKYDLKRHMNIHSDRPHLRRRRNRNKDEGPTEVQSKETIEQPAEVTIDVSAAETVFVEQVLLEEEVARTAPQEESEKENVDALFNLIQYGE